MALFLPFLIAFLVCFLVTPQVIKLANHFGLVDDSQKRPHPAHTHRGIIPRAGGLAIYLGIITASWLFLPINKIILGILAGSSIIIVIGLIDDYKDLSPYFRFLTNILAAAIVVAAGVGIPYLNNPFGGIVHLDTFRLTFTFFGTHSLLVWADFFAIFWIVWCMNMINWSKGVDGQMPGFVGISAIILGILSLRFSRHDLSQQTVTVLSFLTAGAFFGFLPWNFYPQKIMPGYGGGTLAGFLLAVLSILSFGKLGTAVLVMGVPLIDAGYAILRRITSGKSPFRGDRGHLHHKLLSLGWGRRRIALFYWLVSAILGLVAINLGSQQKLLAFVLLLTILGGILLWLSFFTTFLKPPDRGNG